MAKVKEVKEVVPVPTNGEIDTSIDMKLSKQDLIDVVVEETRERLQNQVDLAREAYEEEKINVEKAHREQKELYKKTIEAKFKKEFKLLKDNGGPERKPEIHDSSWHRGPVATEHGIIAIESIKEENVRTSKGHYARRAVTQDCQIIELKYHLPASYGISNQSRDGEDEATCVVSINLQFRLTNAEATKLFTPFVKQLQALAASKAALSALEEQLKGVDKMGKKAKTQLIKRILESSDDGQALLSNINAIKSNVSQLLLEGTK